jgi:hypothetical protein
VSEIRRDCKGLPGQDNGIRCTEVDFGRIITGVKPLVPEMPSDVGAKRRESEVEGVGIGFGDPEPQS